MGNINEGGKCSFMSSNIAIDGPAGAGKSTIAKKLAKDLGYIYVDTGAMYRAMAYYFLSNHIPAENEEAIAAAVPDITISIEYRNGEQCVILNGENVNPYIRQEAVGNMASATSKYPVVREKLVALQQSLAKQADVIMDGRDIGTVVLPDADVKIYLTASSAVRAKRRYDELTAKGQVCNLDEIEQDIINRDYQDMHRETSPLKQAEDAVLLDTSDLDIDGVVAAMKEIIQKAGC
jgi:cytidylate kinase